MIRAFAKAIEKKYEKTNPIKLIMLQCNNNNNNNNSDNNDKTVETNYPTTTMFYLLRYDKNRVLVNLYACVGGISININGRQF